MEKTPGGHGSRPDEARSLSRGLAAPLLEVHTHKWGWEGWGGRGALCWSRESQGERAGDWGEGSHLCLQRNGSGAGEGAEPCQLRVPGQALMAPWPARPPSAPAGTEADTQGAPGRSAEVQPDAGELTEQC